MVNLKNNHGLKVSLYVSNITDYPVVLTTIDMKWYNNNSSCSFEKLCDYHESMATTFRGQLERMQDESTPLSNDAMLARMVREIMQSGFTYDFNKVVD